MDEQRPNDRNHIIEFIAATVEAMCQQMGSMRTEIDSIRSEVGSMHTEIGSIRSEMGSVHTEIGGIRGEMVTKSDLRDAMGALRAEVATKDAMDAGFTAVRADIERLALRLDQVDRSQSLRTAGVETEVSRLRSVVYILAKDQPDLVRMLNA